MTLRRRGSDTSEQQKTPCRRRRGRATENHDVVNIRFPELTERKGFPSRGCLLVKMCAVQQRQSPTSTFANPYNILHKQRKVNVCSHFFADLPPFLICKFCVLPARRRQFCSYPCNQRLPGIRIVTTVISKSDLNQISSIRFLLRGSVVESLLESFQCSRNLLYSCRTKQNLIHCERSRYISRY